MTDLNFTSSGGSQIGCQSNNFVFNVLSSASISNISSVATENFQLLWYFIDLFD